MNWIWIIVVTVLAFYGAWASWQNTQAIKAVMKIIEKYEQMFIDVLKK